MKTKLKSIQSEISNRWNFSKEEQDLYLIAQTGMLTYEQLQMTGIHGSSKESYRIAMKKLEKKKLIEIITYKERKKLLFLSPQGKNFLRQRLSKDALTQVECQLEKPRISKSSPQFLHRLNTNTFYCSYLSAPLSQPCKWLLEYPYGIHRRRYGEGVNRSDGFLETPDGNQYYIEQDNCTQRGAVLYDKIVKYIEEGVFSKEPDLEKRILVFCIDVQLSEKEKEKLQEGQAMHMYRLALKMLKLWKLLEHLNSREYTLGELMKFISSRKEPELVYSFLSARDCTAVVNYFSEFPDCFEDRIQEFEIWKGKMRCDGKEQKEKRLALDASFEKRKNLYYSLADSGEESLFMNRLLKGMSLYLLPLHDIRIQQRFLMPVEYGIITLYEKCMVCMGFCENNGKFRFFRLCRIGADNQCVWFRNTFIQSDICVVWEDIHADIGARFRIVNFLKTNSDVGVSLLFILLVGDTKEAVRFYGDYEVEIGCLEARHVFICFLNKNESFFQNLMLTPFGVRRNDGILKITSFFVEKTDGHLVGIWEDEE